LGKNFPIDHTSRLTIIIVTNNQRPDSAPPLYTGPTCCEHFYREGRSSSWRSSSLPRSLVGGQPPSRGGATNSSRSASGSPFVVPVAADSTTAGKAESPDHEEIQVVAVVTEPNEYHSAIEFEDLKNSQAEGSSPNCASSSKNSPRTSNMQ